PVVVRIVSLVSWTRLLHLIYKTMTIVNSCYLLAKALCSAWRFEHGEQPCRSARWSDRQDQWRGDPMMWMIGGILMLMWLSRWEQGRIQCSSIRVARGR